MARITRDINKSSISLNPEIVVCLYELDFSHLQVDFDYLSDVYGANFSAEPIYRFCSMENQTNPIIWQGKSYQPMPISMNGFESNNEGKLPRPTFAIANPEGIFSRIIHSNHDLANSVLTRKRTYAKYLDDDNFEHGKNPFGQSSSLSRFEDDVYYINKKIEENKEFIKFELVSALELEGAYIPGRAVMSDYCSWHYRSEIGCKYSGLPIETSEHQSLIRGFSKEKGGNRGFVDHEKYRNLSKIPEWSRFGHKYENGEWQQGTELDSFGYQLGDVVKITLEKNKNLSQASLSVFVCCQSHRDASIRNPFFAKEYWLKDECSKSLVSCAKRFTNLTDPNSELNGINLRHYNRSDASNQLNFGGFPGVEQYPI